MNCSHSPRARAGSPLYAVVDAAQVPAAYLMIDHKKLGAAVRALKGAVAIPGVRMWAERTIAAARGE
jgi:hypothetical protein